MPRMLQRAVLLALGLAVANGRALATSDVPPPFRSTSEIVEDIQSRLRAILTAKATGAKSPDARLNRVSYDEKRQLFVVTIHIAARGEQKCRKAIETLLGCLNWEHCWMLDSNGLHPSSFEVQAYSRGSLQCTVSGVAIAPSGPVPTTGLVDELPIAIYQPRPQYPESMKAYPEDVTVLLKTLVDVDSTVREVHVIKSVLAPFDSAAVRAVRSWRFRPAQIGYQSVPAWIIIPVRFSQRDRR